MRLTPCALPAGVTTRSRRRAVAHEALVLDAARRAVRVCATERPVAEQAGERERQEQRDEHPADALDAPLVPMKLQLRFEIVLRVAPGSPPSRASGYTHSDTRAKSETTVKIETISVRVGRDSRNGDRRSRAGRAPEHDLRARRRRRILARLFLHPSRQSRAAARSSNASRRSKAAAMRRRIRPARPPRSRSSACCDPAIT